ncbi:30S ribosomal protein S3 [Methanopyrus sp. KOL6]|uniref:30S ribosomal protein S3 n=1 Tax=Methanopyrus sp. KOL6 TaxID=1937004 RepID=UPI000B4B5FF2|nr:30S ribosomal protein S3 [Methanopyrus sp. KOL6]
MVMYGENVPVHKKFVQYGMLKTELDEYLEQELNRAGYGGMRLQRVPNATKIIAYVERPAIAIGRRGRNIRRVEEEVQERFPLLGRVSIEVKELPSPELNPRVVARRLASALERGIHFRRAAYGALRRIMNAGAKGAMIILSGKLIGARARTEKFVEGAVKYCGEPGDEYMIEGYVQAVTKPGAIGVTVRIMPPDVELPDELEIRPPEEVEDELKELIVKSEDEAEGA